MKLFQKMNNCKKSALPLINKALLVVASLFLGINISLKTCAMPAPVIPEGLTPQVIEGTPGVQYDQSNLYLTLLYSLGLELSQFPATQGEGILRDGLTQEDCDAICEAFNEMNPQDPTLGDDLRSYMQVTSLTYSQNGQVKEFELPRALWVRLNKATKTGLDIKINNPSNTSFSSPTDLFLYFASNYDQELEYNSSAIDACTRCFNAIENGGSWTLIDKPASPGNVHALIFCVDCSYSFSNNTLTIQPLNNNSVYMYAIYTSIGWSLNGMNFGGTSYQVLNSSSGTTINKHVGVANSFIQNKSNESYDLINKSSEIDPNTGKITGPVTMAVLSPAQLQQLQQMINEGLISLSEAMMKLGLSPYDDQTGLLIDSSLSPAQAQLAIANAVDPAPTEPHLARSFEDIDEWNPQSIVPELPLAGVMNWVAVQMNILMNLSQFQNVWLVISTLAVAVLLIGMVRIWKG